MISHCNHHGALILSTAGAPSTPRCSRCGEAIAGREARGGAGTMSGARNENSVLFSLDSLRLLDAGRVDDTPVARPPVPDPGPGEGSGLIDVRALGAMIRPAERPASPAPRFGDLTAAPVALPPSPAAGRRPTRAAAASPPTALYVMLGLVALGMMALAGAMATRQAPAPVVIERHVQLQPAAAEHDEPPETDESPEASPPEAIVAAATPEPEPEPVKVARRPASPKKPQPAAEDRPPPAKPPTPAAAAPTGPAPDSVECLLGGAACKPKRADPPAAVDPPPAVPSASLPAKLEPGDIVDGTRAAKAAALDRCKAHARGGEKITIKLSIAGPEGAVLSAAAQDDAGNPALANCCAAELKRSTFKKVAKAQIGAVATLKF